MLAAYLKDRLQHRRTDALSRLAEVLLGILQAESALHRKIALHLPRSSSLESKTRVVAWVFHDLHLTRRTSWTFCFPFFRTRNRPWRWTARSWAEQTPLRKPACPHLVLRTIPTQYPAPQRHPRRRGVAAGMDGLAPPGQLLGQNSAVDHACSQPWGRTDPACRSTPEGAPSETLGRAHCRP